MTPPDRTDRPWQRDTRDLPPTRPARGASERSASLTPPPVDPEPPTNAVLLAELRSLRAEVARTEGRVMGEVAQEVGKLRAMAVRTEGAELEATRHEMGRRLKGWQAAAAALGLAAGTAGASCATRLLAQHELTDAATQVAAETVEQKAAEIERAHQETRAASDANGRRIDALEQKLDQVLELLQRPTPVVVPAAPKGKHR